MKPLRIIASSIAAAGVVALSLTSPASPANAATVSPYFLKNDPRSNYSINAWSTGSCGGSVHPVYVGQSISSDGWDSAKASNGWEEWIYDDQTGAYLAHRFHGAFECVTLSNNRHLVLVL